ncbi:MAG: DUF378 domain-containing protein [Proteobacteria bacterium]|nr:DUF378 domain-containing protein [Pseudomonadota bacterium]
MSILTLALVIVVGINWVLVEAAQLDLIAAVFGGQEALLAGLLYLLFCLSVLRQIIPLLRAGSGVGTAVQAGC